MPIPFPRSSPFEYAAENRRCQRPEPRDDNLLATARGIISRSIALPAALSATPKSYSACQWSQSSASPPKYRASRRAVSPVTPRLFRRMSFIRGGVTPTAFARAVALSPAGSMKSLRRISPGCGDCAWSLPIGKQPPISLRTPEIRLDRWRFVSYNDTRYGSALQFAHSVIGYRAWVKKRT